MLGGKRIICLCSVTFLFNTYNINISTPFRTLATGVVKDNNIEVVHKDRFGLLINPVQEQYEKDKLESDKRKAEVIKQDELEKSESNNKDWQEFILTYYTSLNSENGYGAITSQGKRLSRGGCANNIIPQNTKIYLENYGQVTVNDKGSNKHFAVDTRLDVFIEREQGESEYEYKVRVLKLGKQVVKGYIVK